MIVYHAIGACPAGRDPFGHFVSTKDFEWQMALLSRRRAVVPLESIVQNAVPRGRRAVAICFDDAYRTVLTEATPILRRHGFVATVFVPTASIGGCNTWDALDHPLEIMTGDELLEANSMGFEIGSHGHAHIDLEQASPSDAEADILASRARLAEILGRPPRYLAYPYGKASREVQEAVSAAGFEAAFTLNQIDKGRYAHGRVPILPFNGRSSFALKTSGHYLAWRSSRLGSVCYSVIVPLLRRSRGSSSSSGIASRVSRRHKTR